MTASYPASEGGSVRHRTNGSSAPTAMCANVSVFVTARSAARAACFNGVTEGFAGKRRLMAQNILLIQEEPTDATAVREALVHSSDGPFQVEWVKRCSEALERLAGEGATGASGFAAILVDLFLPD